MAEQEFDLFGDPVRLSNGRRGRPSHVPTQENRNKIMMLIAMGWSNERCANALHISLPTLRRHYFSELKARDMHRDRLDASRFMKVWAEVEKGNVGAMRLLDQMIAKSDMMLAAAQMRGAAPKDDDDEEGKLGKKEVARRAAQDAVQSDGDDVWGDDLTPGVIN